VFSGDETRAPHDVKHHIHESPWVMVVPLVLLAIGAAVGGLIGVPGSLFDHPEWNLFAHSLEPVVGAEMEIPHGTEIGIMVGSTVLALGGIGLAFAFYGGGYREPARKFAAAFPGFVRLVQDKFRIDELYDALVVRPVKAISRGLFVFVDRIIVDKFLVEGIGKVVDWVSRIARVFQMGDGQRYMAVFAVGVAVLVYFVSRPTVPDGLRVTTNGRAVEVDARRPGRASASPLDYAFDFNDDGKPEATGGTTTASHVYGQPGEHTIRVTITDPRWGTSKDLKTKVEVK
jgi:hypothetical protein